jgi:hypothetical protein
MGDTRGSLYHLDHIYSIIDGFKNNILPEIIASPINLRVILSHKNLSKNYRSSITKDMLYKLYSQFNSEMEKI